MEETAARLKKLCSAPIYDIMDREKLPSRCLDLRIAPLNPMLQVGGPAYTVVPGAEETPAIESESREEVRAGGPVAEVYAGFGRL